MTHATTGQLKDTIRDMQAGLDAATRDVQQAHEVVQIRDRQLDAANARVEAAEADFEFVKEARDFWLGKYDAERERVVALELVVLECQVWAAARDYKNIDECGENIERLSHIERITTKALEVKS